MTEYEILKIQQLKQNGFGYKKIAATLGLSVNSVKSYLQRHSRTPCVCERCGKPIVQTPQRKHKRFCSDACRTIWWNQHADAGNHRTVHTFSCLLCGRSFSSPAKVRRYCSRTCYANARRKAVVTDG